MHVIGHQCIGVQGAAVLAERLVQPVQIGEVVLFGKEAGRTVVAALHNVQGNAVEVNARAPGHDGIVARRSKAGPFCDEIENRRPAETDFYSGNLLMKGKRDN